MTNLEGGPERPQTLLERLQAERPGKRVINTAIEKLTDPDEIREFAMQYDGLMKETLEDYSEEAVRANISFAVGNYDEETRDRWAQVLSESGSEEER